MPQREFDITIAPDGSVALHVKGYKGRSCLEAMKIFEQVVGELKSFKRRHNTRAVILVGLWICRAQRSADGIQFRPRLPRCDIRFQPPDGIQIARIPLRKRAALRFGRGHPDFDRVEFIAPDGTPADFRFSLFDVE